MISLSDVILGIVIGCGYGLLALGWTVLLGAARVVNFAHGQLYMLGAFVTWWAMTQFGLPYWIALIATLVLVAVIGALMQGVLLRMTMTHDLVRIMIVTLGFGYVITALATILFGGNAQQVSSPLQVINVDVLGTPLTLQDLLVVVLTLVLFTATYLVMRHTRVGRVIRAVAEDPQLADLAALRPAWVYIGVFAFAAAMAALAGGLLSTQGPVFTSAGSDQVIFTFVIVVLGGVGRIWGNLIAALLVGIFAALFGTLISPAYTTAVLFLLVLIVFTIRPQGVQRQ
jgi:branched-chain amino acid transport system permease protein